MSLSELKHYVLAHRNDEDAWTEFASRDRQDAIYFEANTPLIEQKNKLKELLKLNSRQNNQF